MKIMAPLSHRRIIKEATGGVAWAVFALPPFLPQSPCELVHTGSRHQRQQSSRPPDPVAAGNSRSSGDAIGSGGSADGSVRGADPLPPGLSKRRHRPRASHRLGSLSEREQLVVVFTDSCLVNWLALAAYMDDSREK
ncbi:hypothetical protein E2562_033050 [Oryza meyeriana var. granulata]|uniref:Uncharacterized protein n=1 Tax=Oryza meyeriana var. granulata TaxID=110450 RepID=A0A6G1CLF0_9ORYZ|nr:hypothetical protein E2562_033050 [Oryza meyeriana var. granulata]